MKRKIIITFIYFFFFRESQEFRSNVPDECVHLLWRFQRDQQLHGDNSDV